MISTGHQFKDAIIEVYSDRETWLDARRLGSSDAAALIGYGYADQTPYTVWAEKVEGYSAHRSESKDKHLEKGKIAEKYIAELLKLEHGWDVDRGPPHSFYRSKQHAFLTASLDGVVFDHDGATILEMKAISAWQAREWDFQAKIAPIGYAVQAIHQMMVTGCRRAKIVVLVGLDLHVIPVPWNQSLVDKLTAIYKGFWDRVESKTPPPLDGSDATFKAIQFINRKAKVDPLRLEGRDAEDLEAYAIAHDEFERKKADLDLMRNRVAAIVGQHELATTPSGCCVVNRKHGKGRRMYPIKGKAGKKW